MKPNWALLFVCLSARALYLPTKIRIRQWGWLPSDRGPTVLITNHQHMDEGENVIRRLFFRDPWKRIVMVNSRRTFETGFFAARLPWTAPFTRKLNLTKLWLGFGIYPVENHLHARSLTSLAEEIRSAHGDIALDDVLAPETLAKLGLTGRRLDELWTPQHFASAQTTIKLSHLREPYRSEAIANFRATLASDVATVVEAVRDDGTLYVTPEGDFSRDGRMHRMRAGMVDPMLPFAEPWLCAIAYDPFRGRRLSMLYRIVRPADPTDFGTSRAAARPVTTSALLSTFLLEAPMPFTLADATRAVRRQIDALPAGVFVDPELFAAPEAVTAEAAALLVARGTLAPDGAGYRLTERRGDARFPHVADMVTFQRNMLEETLATAQRLATAPA